MSGPTRRAFLARGAAAAGALALPATARAGSGSFDGTIRLATIFYDIPGNVLNRAEKALGLKIDTQFTPPYTMNRLVRQEPGAFDIVSSFSHCIDPQWPTGNLRPVEIAKIARWKEVTSLLKLGKLRPGDPRCSYGEGDAAYRKLYVDPERSGRWRSAPATPRALEGEIVQWADQRTGLPVGPEPRFCTGVPVAFNLDSFGYNTHFIRKQPDELSWSELLNRKWRGRVALPADTQTGFQDAGLAARAAGLVRIRDLGHPTRREIDALVKVLLSLRSQRQFYGVWADAVGQAAPWMKSGHVVIGSMWAIALSPLAALGVPVRQAAPREGYRAFAGIYSISSAVTDPAKLRACYDFINWWLSGYWGAEMLRWDYLTAVTARSRRFMSAAEYGYWLEGKRAAGNYTNPSGDAVAHKGDRRDGGAFSRRVCKIGSWNSWTSEPAHLEKRWHEFVSSF